MDKEEQKKAVEVLRQKEKGELLDWMYKGEKPDAEEYLLGKRIDRHVEDKDEPTEDGVGAIFGERIQANITLDMQAKMREDPLFAIRKQEEESKKRLLQNPVKMKQLQQMLHRKEQTKKSKHKHSKKKHKKKKSSSSSEEEQDDDLVTKYLSILNQKRHKDPGRHRQPPVSTSDDNNSHRNHKQFSVDRRKASESKSDDEADRRKPSHVEVRHKKVADSDSDDDSRRKPKVYGLVKTRHGSPSPSRQLYMAPRQQRSPSPRRHSTKHKFRSRSRSPRRRRSRSRSPRIRNRSPSPCRRPRSKSPPKREIKRKLTAEEKQKKLEEMMQNASWRDDQRKQNVKQYADEAKLEENKQFKQGDSAGFINPIMRKHVEKSSIEERLKRNRYNIQRTKADLDKDFTKH